MCSQMQHFRVRGRGDCGRQAQLQLAFILGVDNRGQRSPMLQKILVTTDFSVAARRAVTRAALLARDKGAEVTLLHVLPERGLFDRVFRHHDIDYAAMAAGAERALHAELESMRAHAAVAVKPLIREGVAHRVIATAAAELAATLVV